MLKWPTIFAAVVGITLMASSAAAAQDTNSTDCNPTNIPVLTGKSGNLKIQISPDKWPGKTCQWNVNVTDGFLHLDIEELVISANDTLKVTTIDGKTTFFESRGSLHPGVIFIGNQKQIQISIIFTNDSNNNRVWDVMYGNDQTAQLLNIAGTGRFVFPYTYQNSDFKDISFSLTLRTKYNNKKLLMNMEPPHDFNDTLFSFDKVDKYTNQNLTGTTYPDFLLSTDQQINIKISKYSKSAAETKNYTFHYELVDSICSSYKKLTDLDKNKTVDIMNLPTTVQLQSLSSYRCLRIYEHENQDSKLLLDLSGFKFVNTEDIITVLDGNTANSQPLAVIDSHFVNIYWSDQYLYSSANKLWILYDSPQVINTVRQPLNVIGIQALSQGGSYQFPKNDTLKQIVYKTSKTVLLPVTYLFNGNVNQQLAIDFDEKKPLPGTANKLFMQIFDETGRNGKPIIELIGGSYPPDIMAVNGMQLKIVFNQNVTEDFKLNVIQVPKGCYSTVTGNSAAYSLSGCQTMCSWLIPKRADSVGTFVFQFSHLNLPKDSDVIELVELGTKDPFKIIDLKGSLQSTTFPDMNLDSRQTYALTVRRVCDKSSIDGSQLLGVSVIFIDKNLNQNNITFNNETVNSIIQTSNYPNYYPLGSDSHWFINGTVGTGVDLVFITFTDFDINSGNELFIMSPMKSNISVPSKLSQIPDYLLQMPVFIDLNSQLISSKSDPFSGRGFNARIQALKCGGIYEVSSKATTNITTPSTLAGVPQCVWMITTDNPSKGINVMSFELIRGEGFDDKNLKIYDSNNTRDLIEVNQTLFKTWKDNFYNTSVNTMIIVYIIDPKKPAPLTIKVTQTACDRLCHNNERCFLPQFQCNGHNDCGDFTDEFYCNRTVPPVPPAPVYTSTGVNGWVVTLVICPLMVGLGVLGTLYGPQVLNRFGRGRYQEFHDFSAVS
ncbi:uncharacterized protein LOC128956433 [Oppia nitens]|uniref:uncharacterized protein LOC128956433 n=1 Tax=Oppia nitens TaxID=1686743 RepID=UPI0023DA7F02|nr:uncharacterized protein LOC128956433 [Oppia nitens]